MPLRCPQCGNSDLDQIRYLEDILCWRKLESVQSDGRVVINGLYRTGEGYDDGTHPRFCCSVCGCMWPAGETPLEFT